MSDGDLYDKSHLGGLNLIRLLFRLNYQVSQNVQ